MKVALVHDWLVGMRGGERCLEAFISIYPDADIFTLLHVPNTTSKLIDSRVVGTSPLQSIPYAKNLYRHFLPFYPYVVSKLDFTGYDLVISLSHAAVKNINVPKNVPHICYCFTPMRYIWDQASTYFGKSEYLLYPILNFLRFWDINSSRRVDNFVAISNLVAARIRSFYGRSSTVIYPPTNTEWLKPNLSNDREIDFLYAGALVKYKKVDTIIEACLNLGVSLAIVGSGPDEIRLKNIVAKAKYDKITFYGRVTDEQLSFFYSQAKALIFAAKEDFGLVPVEALSSGTPVIGFYHGGLREVLTGVKPWLNNKSNAISLDDNYTGVFASPHEDSVTSLISALEFFLRNSQAFTPQNCIDRGRKFSLPIFINNWNEFIADLIC
jgi:glycosyltransferase involved in cell wall biosynthesis